jgi:hypothetical protein
VAPSRGRGRASTPATILSNSLTTAPLGRPDASVLGAVLPHRLGELRLGILDVPGVRAVQLLPQQNDHCDGLFTRRLVGVRLERGLKARRPLGLSAHPRHQPRAPRQRPPPPWRTSAAAMRPRPPPPPRALPSGPPRLPALSRARAAVCRSRSRCCNRWSGAFSAAFSAPDTSRSSRAAGPPPAPPSPRPPSCLLQQVAWRLTRPPPADCPAPQTAARPRPDPPRTPPSTPRLRASLAPCAPCQSRAVCASTLRFSATDCPAASAGPDAAAAVARAAAGVGTAWAAVGAAATALAGRRAAATAAQK